MQAHLGAIRGAGGKPVAALSRRFLAKRDRRASYRGTESDTFANINRPPFMCSSRRDLDYPTVRDSSDSISEVVERTVEVSLVGTVPIGIHPHFKGLTRTIPACLLHFTVL